MSWSMQVNCTHSTDKKPKWEFEWFVSHDFTGQGAVESGLNEGSI